MVSKPQLSGIRKICEFNNHIINMFSPITTLYTYFPLQFFIRIAIDLLIMAFGVFLAVKMYRSGKFDKLQRAACILLFIYGAIILLFTVLGRRSHDDYELNYNLELFSCYYRIFIECDRSILESILQNILMFIPIGAILPIIFSYKHRILIPIAISFGLSLLIETCQLVLKSGLFELDDLFNNTIGGMIGIILCLTVSYIYHKVLKNHRKEDSIESKANR